MAGICLTGELSMGVIRSNPRAAGAGAAFTPPDITGLSMWYDPSDAGNRAVSAGLVVTLENKASPGTATAHGGSLTNATSPQLASAAINSRDALYFDTASQRSIQMSDEDDPANKFGTDGFRVFVVVKFGASPTTAENAIIFNCATDANGGNVNCKINSGAVDRLRVAATDTGSAHSAQAIDDASLVNDGNTHVLMFGRRIGTGTAGVDQLLSYMDGSELQITDLNAAHGAMSNSSASSPTVSRWFLIGAQPSGSTAGQFFLDDCYIGEVVVYKADLDTDEEQQVYEYLAARWAP